MNDGGSIFSPVISGRNRTATRTDDSAPPWGTFLKRIWSRGVCCSETHDRRPVRSPVTLSNVTSRGDFSRGCTSWDLLRCPDPGFTSVLAIVCNGEERCGGLCTATRGIAARPAQRGGGGDADGDCVRLLALLACSSEPLAVVEQTATLERRRGVYAPPRPGVEIPMRDDAETAVCVPPPLLPTVGQEAFCLGLLTRLAKFLMCFSVGLSAAAASGAETTEASTSRAGATAGARPDRTELPERG